MMSSPHGSCLWSHLSWLSTMRPSGDGMKTWSLATAGVQVQFSIPSMSLCPFQWRTKIIQCRWLFISELWASLPTFVPVCLHPYKWNTPWGHPFPPGIKKPPLESWFAIHFYLWDCLPCRHESPAVAETLEWVRSSSDVYRVRWDLCPASGCVPAGPHARWCQARCQTLLFFPKTPEIQIGT